MSFMQVDTARLRVKDYGEVVPAAQMDRVRSLGESLMGARIAHVNSTAIGGGVAEILKSLAPLMSDCGPDTRWLAIEGAPEFFEVTKKLHNLLQGAEGALSQREYEIYLSRNAQIAKDLVASNLNPDVWVLHDPQTLPLVSFLPEGSKIVWVCHIDTTRPNQKALRQLLPFMQKAQRVVFSMPQYVVPGLDRSRVRIIPPAIDPLTVKNTEPENDSLYPTLSRLGLDVERPIVTQVARFDHWKDPWGVIDAYRMAKKALPGLQLALLGVIEAHDDPGAFSVLESVRQYAGHDADIHMFADPKVVGQPEVAAFQKGSDVVIQKSLREGFGLSVTEALWKGAPVIGGNCGGIRLQIAHGKTGFLVDSIEDCARRMVELLGNPKLGRWMGAAAKESVRQRFLMPRLLGDYMAVANELAVVPVAEPLAEMSMNGVRVGSHAPAPSIG